jgi:hypothetical protein
MERRIESGWLRFDSDEVMRDLEHGLTPRLAARAIQPDRHHIRTLLPGIQLLAQQLDHLQA